MYSTVCELDLSLSFQKVSLPNRTSFFPAVDYSYIPYLWLLKTPQIESSCGYDRLPRNLVGSVLLLASEQLGMLRRLVLY